MEPTRLGGVNLARPVRAPRVQKPTTGRKRKGQHDGLTPEPPYHEKDDPPYIDLVSPPTSQEKTSKSAFAIVSAAEPSRDVSSEPPALPSGADAQTLAALQQCLAEKEAELQESRAELQESRAENERMKTHYEARLADMEKMAEAEMDEFGKGKQELMGRMDRMRKDNNRLKRQLQEGAKDGRCGNCDAAGMEAARALARAGAQKAALQQQMQQVEQIVNGF